MKKRIITSLLFLGIIPIIVFGGSSCTFEDILDHSSEKRKELDKNNEKYDFIITPQNVKGDFRTFFQSIVDKHSNILIKDGTYDIELISEYRAIKPKNGCTITFESNAKIKVKPNGLDIYSVIDLKSKNNVTIINPNIEGDKYTHLGATGEWGNGINITDCSDIKIVNARISKMWGDGLYINNAKNVKIHNPVLDDNRRQGISIISCENVEIHSPIISNTSGTYPAFGIVVEPNQNGEHVKNLKIYNAIFRNNGKLNDGGEFEGDFAGFCLSPHQISKKKPTNQKEFIPTTFDIELISPIFEGDQLLISASSDLVKGKLTVKNPEFRESYISAVYILNHQSNNFETEIANPLFYNCVKKTNLLSSYFIPMLFNCNKQGVKTTGNKNISIRNPRFIADKNATFNKNAIRNITPSSFSEDLKDVRIENLIIDGYSIPFYNHSGISDPNLSNFSNLHSKFILTINTEKSKLPSFGFSRWSDFEVVKNLDKTIVNINENTIEAPIIYLNDNIPISGFELYYANNSTNKVPLNLNFGTKSTLTKKTIQREKQKQRLSSSITIPHGSHVTLIKKGTNLWEVVNKKSSSNIQY